MRKNLETVAALAAAAVMTIGCGDSSPEEQEEARDPGDIPYALLSDYQFFDGDMAEMVPAEGVIPFTVAAPLFSDNAGKGRFIVLPEGGTIEVTEEDEWEFPVGSIVVKSFFFDTDRRDGPTAEDTRIIETRLLEFSQDGLQSHIYVWNDEQTEAEYLRAGADVFVDYVDAAGAAQSQLYLVPDENACGSCHERDDVLRVLGPTTMQMNRTVDGGTQNQIEWLAEQGVLAGSHDPAALPALPDPTGDADLDARARAYLHGNCSHCHRPGGGGGASGLKFGATVQEPDQFGVCKVPSAAGAGAGGNAYDIVPGHPEDSIVVYRMASTDPEIKMPELPSLLADEVGVEIISEWIAAMPEQDCANLD